MAGGPPWGRPPTTHAARSPDRACRPRGQCWAPTPTHPHPQRVGGGPQQPTQWARSRGGTAPDLRRPSQWWKAPPSGDALPPPPQQATQARKGARFGAGAGSPRPHQLHPGHTGRGTLAARSRGPAAGEGTAPDTRRLSQQWQATPPPGTAPHHFHGTQRPQGMQAKGDSVGPPDPHTGAGSTWVADPNSPHSGRAVGGGTAPDLRRPSQWWKAPPRGRSSATPTVTTPAHKGARCGAGAGSPRPHRPHPGDTGRGTLAARSRGQAAGGGTAPDTRRPSQQWQATPPGRAPHHPRGTQPPQGMQAKGTVLGPHTHTPAPTARGWRIPTACPVGGQLGEGQRLT